MVLPMEERGKLSSTCVCCYNPLLDPSSACIEGVLSGL